MRRMFPLVAILPPVLGLAIGTASRAADTPSKAEAPDLSAIRAKLKVKEFALARDELFKLAGTHEHAEVYNLLGFALRKLGDYTRAQTYYSKALDYDPDHLGALEYQGELYVALKQLDRAKANLAKLVKLCPTGCEEREDLEKAIAVAADAAKAR